MLFRFRSQMSTETVSCPRPVSSAPKAREPSPIIFILLLLQKGTSKTVNAGSSRRRGASPPRAEAARQLCERLERSRDDRGFVF